MVSVTGCGMPRPTALLRGRSRHLDFSSCAAVLVQFVFTIVIIYFVNEFIINIFIHQMASFTR